MDKKELLELGLKFRGGAFPGETWESLNNKYKRPFPSGEAYRSFVRRELKKENKLSNDKVVNNINKNYTLDINKDGSQTSTKLIEMSEEQAKDSNYLLEKHGYSKLEFELISAKNSIWNSGKKILYSSKITVKPKKTTFDPMWVKEVLEELDLNSPVVSPIPYNVKGKTLEINIADAHINKLCAIDETGNKYSLDIGIQRLWQIIEHIIHNTKYLKIKKILFPFGQDCANIDNIFKCTTKGTPQDVSANYDVMYKTILKNIIKIIYKLLEIAPVEIIYVGGNHDKLTSFTMAEAMYWHFLNNDNVEVDSVFNNRKYRLIGNVLLGFAHGDDEKKNIIYCMQNDVPELWGKAKYREFHLSHFHKEVMVDEKNGIIMRWISSISGTDAWTYNGGYIGSQKKAQSFVWDDEKGLEIIINSYI
ncbi:MAG: hypothetical protein GX941_05060 [Candidatus Methanofastidiosa archaeon]|nr:hypothetical protein [Candidatus Methanofastidiosa archaeon]